MIFSNLQTSLFPIEPVNQIFQVPDIITTAHTHTQSIELDLLCIKVILCCAKQQLAKGRIGTKQSRSQEPAISLLLYNRNCAFQIKDLHKLWFFVCLCQDIAFVTKLRKISNQQNTLLYYQSMQARKMRIIQRFSNTVNNLYFQLKGCNQKVTPFTLCMNMNSTFGVTSAQQRAYFQFRCSRSSAAIFNPNLTFAIL